jgi:hypothetical protein
LQHTARRAITLKDTPYDPGASSWIEFVFWSLDRLGLAVPESVLGPCGAALAVLLVG